MEALYILLTGVKEHLLRLSRSVRLIAILSLLTLAGACGEQRLPKGCYPNPADMPASERAEMRRSVDGLVIRRMLNETRVVMPWRAYPIDLAFVNCPQNLVFKPSVHNDPPNIYMKFWIPDLIALEPDTRTSSELFYPTGQVVVDPRQSQVVEARLSAPPANGDLPRALNLLLDELKQREKVRHYLMEPRNDGLDSKHILNSEQFAGVIRCRISGRGPCRVDLYFKERNVEVWAHYSNQTAFSPDKVAEFIFNYVNPFFVDESKR